jgi:hypothetical protein
VAGLGEGVGDATPGPKRDIAFVRDAARQDDDVQAAGIAHDQGFLHYFEIGGLFEV